LGQKRGVNCFEGLVLKDTPVSNFEEQEKRFIQCSLPSSGRTR